MPDTASPSLRPHSRVHSSFRLCVTVILMRHSTILMRRIQKKKKTTTLIGHKFHFYASPHSVSHYCCNPSIGNSIIAPYKRRTKNIFAICCHSKIYNTILIRSSISLCPTIMAGQCSVWMTSSKQYWLIHGPLSFATKLNQNTNRNSGRIFSVLNSELAWSLAWLNAECKTDASLEIAFAQSGRPIVVLSFISQFTDKIARTWKTTRTKKALLLLRLCLSALYGYGEFQPLLLYKQTTLELTLLCKLCWERKIWFFEWWNATRNVMKIMVVLNANLICLQFAVGSVHCMSWIQGSNDEPNVEVHFHSA